MRRLNLNELTLVSDGEITVSASKSEYTSILSIPEIKELKFFLDDILFDIAEVDKLYCDKASYWNRENKHEFDYDTHCKNCLRIL